MALGVTNDLSVYSLLKEYYGAQQLEALVFRNDPVLGGIKKERIGGKYIPLPMAVYGNGGVTADFLQVTSQAPNTYLGVAMQVVPGQLFSSFVLDPKEYLASQGDRAAFLSVFAIRAMLAMDDLRKMLASCFYRSGYLEQGPIQAVDTNYLYIDVDPSTAMALTPGMPILFYLPSNGVPGTARSLTPNVIKSIGNVYSTGFTRVTFTSAYPTTVAVSDLVVVKGGIDAAGNPNAPVGLAQWLPTVSNRDGSATWSTYIQTKFYGVDRSIAPDRMAGQFVLKTSTETYSQALQRLLKVVRRGGGVPDLIIVNDDDFTVLAQDALANRVFWQDIQGSKGKEKNKVTQGIDAFQIGFSSSWIDRVVDSPYCPKGLAYVLDVEAVRLYTITNSAPILDSLPTGNEPGAPKATDGKEPTTNYMFLNDDMYTTTPVALQSGMGIRVDYQFYGNFALPVPAHCGVCKFYT